MYFFPLFLIIGFSCNWASAFTSEFSARWGLQAGRMISFFLRMVFGLPVWSAGVAIAFRQSAPWVVQPATTFALLAWAAIFFGSALMFWALGFVGLRAILPSLRDTLASRGPYRFLRHPIYAGLLLVFAAFILLQPTLPVILASTLGLIFVLVQTRLEEWDLLRRMPSYRSYMEEVPRFIPRLRGNT